MIKVTDLNLNVGEFSLDNISLTVADRQYFVLLGPTGSGKTLFLECLCGLIQPHTGKIEIDGQDVTNLPPRLRRIGYVPQDYGLFPHLTVEKNVIFGLRTSGMSYEESCNLVRPIIEMLSLNSLLKRSPMTLSGGERQKVALARALVTRPNLLLMDEPVSALDEQNRSQVCQELRRIQKELAVTTIHVSHNMEEAMTVSGKAGILQDGKLAQTGRIIELVRKPETEFVARFFRAKNILEGMAEPSPNGGATITLAGKQIHVKQDCRGKIKFVVRAELIKVAPDGIRSENAIQAILMNICDVGVYRQLEFDAGIRIFVYALPESKGKCFKLGEKYSIILPSDGIQILK